MHWNELHFTGCSFTSLPALIAPTKWKVQHRWLYDLQNKNNMETVFWYKDGTEQLIQLLRDQKGSLAQCSKQSP